MVTIHFHRAKEANNKELYMNERVDTWLNASFVPNVGDIYIYHKEKIKAEEDLLDEFLDSFKFSELTLIPCKIVARTWLDKDTVFITVEGAI